MAHGRVTTGTEDELQLNRPPQPRVQGQVVSCRCRQRATSECHQAGTMRRPPANPRMNAKFRRRVGRIPRVLGNSLISITPVTGVQSSARPVTPPGGIGIEFVAGSAARPVVEKLLNPSTG